MNFKRYLLFAGAMLLADWILGALHAARIIPLWSFLIFNFPFGAPYVWFESHWAGTSYRFGAQFADELWAFVAWLFAVLAQAWLYTVLLARYRAKRHALSA
jgi:hypothetical protein